MNDADVSKQMQQMVRFIRLEAQEKANEISISAEEEFNIAKLQIVEAEKRKVMQEYDRKAKQVDIRKKMAYRLSSGSKLPICTDICGHVREIDVELIESILEEAKEQYAEKANDCAPMITLDNRVYLLPPPSSEESNGPSCAGGVILASQDGKIVCDNTLDARLDVVFRQKTP
ncbi:unnamed protein product [Thlaspi arvense]|uniref:Vacuolar ATP synthase subunit E n=1 Tax=Thlaspi arvense TaxID=13288 RepID=A0AAU9RXG0_THLAR|nr:unnamed protein product [Thlaspi arvense]